MFKNNKNDISIILTEQDELIVDFDDVSIELHSDDSLKNTEMSMDKDLFKEEDLFKDIDLGGVDLEDLNIEDIELDKISIDIK